MNFSELLAVLGLEDVEVVATLIVPIRKGEVYTSGRVIGFKSGIYGGGWSKGGKSYDSRKRRWLKKPKVNIVYNCFEYMKGEHNDWVDIENCTFEIKKNQTP
jgi:hypothetical protein